MKSIRWIVTERERLPDSIAKKLQLPSKKRARLLLDQGCCYVNDRIQRFANLELEPGDRIEVILHEASEVPALDIAYEDEWLYILNKPAGLVVDQETISRELNQEIFLVHRLDKFTSGALLVAKDAKTQKALEEQFRKRKIAKGYLAIVDGCLEPTHGEITDAIEKKGLLSKVSDAGKSARTAFDVIASSEFASLVFLRPLTGRTHQLRVHMAHVGFPILGDYYYSDQFLCNLKPKRYLLHAWKITFNHPFMETPLPWTVSMPDDMLQTAKRLFGYEFRKKLCALSL